MLAISLLMLIAGAAMAQAPGPAPQRPDGLEIATFAGGCFWCVESDFEKVEGVVSAVSGYTGGTTPNPTYKQVSNGGTGHAESVQVTFDPKKVTYAKLLDVFWHSTDPTDGGGQFCDRGDHYRSAIFYHSEEQKRAAEDSKKALEASGQLKQPIATQVIAAGPFFAAEEYHQAYAKKNPIRYKIYRTGCGRDARLQQLWGNAATH
jgi:peptide-methionine (S)-S-oxide reductase